MSDRDTATDRWTFTYGTSGSTPAARMSATAASGSTGAFPPQYRHPPHPLRMPLNLGDTSLPHLRQRDRHGVSTLVYGSSGSTPAARISAAATSGSMRAGIRTQPGSRRCVAVVRQRLASLTPMLRHEHATYRDALGSSCCKPRGLCRSGSLCHPVMSGCRRRILTSCVGAEGRCRAHPGRGLSRI
jgi:hypothetical protein